MDAMRYTTLGAGKRLRALLALATAEALGHSWEHALPVAAALECVHAYSLVHDDLPAMDDDNLRRGKPTCHIAYNEATAILVGDALQTLAFEILSDTELGYSPETQLKMLNTLAKAIGSQGMVKGQALDMAYEAQTITLPQLETLHQAKTGALIEASVLLGALTVPNLSPSVLTTLQDFSKHLGLAFQIQDDILDVVGSTDELGKPAKSDENKQKSTYPSLLGLTEANHKATEHVQLALAALTLLPHDTTTLETLAHYMIERNA